MRTNFFSSIKNLGIQGSCTLTIAQQGDDLLMVSLLFAHDQANLPPMVFKGTPEEMDEAFFGALETPVKETVTLFANLDAYQQSVREAQDKAKASAAAKTKTVAVGNVNSNAEKLEKEEKRKAYTEAIRQVVELDKACRYDEAIQLLPDEAEYPDKAEELTKRRTELERKSEQKKQLLF